MDSDDEPVDAKKALSKMIRRVLEDIAKDWRGFRKEDFNEILSWVAYARRSLTLAELDAVLKLKNPLGQGVPDLEERLRQQFAPFFVLVRRDGLTTEALLERASRTADDLDPGAKAPDTKTENNDNNTSGTVSSNANLPPKVKSSNSCDSDPYQTTIRFSHRAIKYFFYSRAERTDPETRAFLAGLGLSVDKNEAEKHIAMTCLRVLTEELKLPGTSGSGEDRDGSESGETKCGSKGSKSGPVSDLSGYAAIGFISHLTCVERSTWTVEDEQVIAKSMLRLFLDDTAIKNWIDNSSDLGYLARNWLEEDSCRMDFVRSWLLKQLLNSERYSAEEVEQMRKAIEPGWELFKPMAMYCAKRWLTVDDQHKDIEGYVNFLDLYIPHDGETTLPRNVTFEPVESLQGISEVRLQKLAEFANLEKTSFWHGYLAKAMRFAGHFNAAIQGSHTAIELNDRNQIAMTVLSTCYEDLGLYGPAIHWARKALGLCPNEQDRSRCWQIISRCSLKVGDFQEAKAAAREACTLVPDSGAALSAYALALDAEMDHSGLFDYVEGLQKQLLGAAEWNLLTKALLANEQLLSVLGHAARALGKLDFVIQAAEAAIKVAVWRRYREAAANQRALLAFLYFTQLDHLKAVRLWDLVLYCNDASAGTERFTSDKLSMSYYAEAAAAEGRVAEGRAVEGGKYIPDDPCYWVSKLEELTECGPGGYLNTRQSSTSGASLMLGLWHRNHGNLVEARNCCRAQVLGAIEKLTDTDPYNGREGWSALAEALMKAGDRLNAAASITVAMQEFDRLKARKSSALDNESTESLPPVATTSNWHCHGQCRRRAESWAALHICETCLGLVCFCEECVGLLKGGELPFRVCDPKHVLYQAYPVREGFGMTEDGMIRVNRKAVELKEWLRELKEQWVGGEVKGNKRGGRFARAMIS